MIYSFCAAPALGARPVVNVLSHESANASSLQNMDRDPTLCIPPVDKKKLIRVQMSIMLEEHFLKYFSHQTAHLGCALKFSACNLFVHAASELTIPDHVYQKAA